MIPKLGLTARVEISAQARKCKSGKGRRMCQVVTAEMGTLQFGMIRWAGSPVHGCLGMIGS